MQRSNINCDALDQRELTCLMYALTRLIYASNDKQRSNINNDVLGQCKLMHLIYTSIVMLSTRVHRHAIIRKGQAPTVMLSTIVNHLVKIHKGQSSIMMILVMYTPKICKGQASTMMLSVNQYAKREHKPGYPWTTLVNTCIMINSYDNNRVRNGCAKK